MTTACTPSSAISFSVLCSTMDSGVVLFDGRCVSCHADSMVPIRPISTPALSRMERTRYVVVVFPLVPVMPIIFILRAGCPKNAADTRAMPCLVDRTRTMAGSFDTSCPSEASSRERSERIAAAPFAATCGA